MTISMIYPRHIMSPLESAPVNCIYLVPDPTVNDTLPGVLLDAW